MNSATAPLKLRANRREIALPLLVLVSMLLTTAAMADSSPDESLTNTFPPPTPTKHQLADRFEQQLEQAVHLRQTREPGAAEQILKQLFQDGAPESVQKSALLELAMDARDQDDLPRAEQICAQFLTRWTDDHRVPEVLLLQGRIFRQMGVDNLALAKFYSVMTAALSLKSDELKYYQHLVFLAQTEIAETNYQMNKFNDAADFYLRLLKEGGPELDREQVQFKLVRALAATGRAEETAAQAQTFLAAFTNAPEDADVLFYRAEALKKLGRNDESLQAVLELLRNVKSQKERHPELWEYWRQRAGNEIANQFYRDGDYMTALNIYRSLEQMDNASSWTIPVSYQIGLTYEKLQQPVMALQTYSNIVSREITVSTNAPPALKSVFDMAQWRMKFIQWRQKAEAENQILTLPEVSSNDPAGALLPAKGTNRTVAAQIHLSQLSTNTLSTLAKP